MVAVGQPESNRRQRRNERSLRGSQVAEWGPDSLGDCREAPRAPPVEAKGQRRECRNGREEQAERRWTVAMLDLLGCTSSWRRLREGDKAACRSAAKSRFACALGAGNEWCRRHRYTAVSPPPVGYSGVGWTGWRSLPHANKTTLCAVADGSTPGLPREYRALRSQLATRGRKPSTAGCRLRRNCLGSRLRRLLLADGRWWVHHLRH